MVFPPQSITQSDLTQPDQIYLDSDGKPMADNTEQLPEASG